jgi:glyoxylase-like metal-dependent hydrolase (beta-lactamase superfamily II)
MAAPEFRTAMEFAYGVPRELAPGVSRVVANNPSVFTFKGTNTYILGSRELAIMDPGPEDPDHFEAVMAAVAGRKVSHILITHTHRDHVDGLPRMAEATGAVVCGYGRQSATPDETKSSPSGTEFVDQSFKPDLILRDGDVVAGADWSVEALHTPGHAPDHLCFAMPDRGIMFSGDHVMGWNTSVVAPPEGNMSDYMSALERLMGRQDDVYFPGHGGRIENPARFAKAFLIHRRNREKAILDSVRAGNSTIADVVAHIYKDLDQRLIRAASLSVLAHIEHLIARNLIRTQSPPSLDSIFTAV